MNANSKIKLSPQSVMPVFLIFIAFVINIVTIIYVLKNHMIYYWDNSRGWELSIKLSQLPVDSKFFNDIYTSITRLDFNYLGVIIPSFMARLFGESRLVYVLSLLNFYVLPCMLEIYHISKKLTKKHIYTVCVILLFLPFMLYLTQTGYVDILCIFLGILCFDLYIKTDDKPYLGYKHIILGLILTFMILYKSYLIFFVLSFITAMICDCILSHRKIKYLLFTIIPIALIISVFFRWFFINHIIKIYADLTGIKNFSLSFNIFILSKYFGGLSLIICTVGALVILIKNHLKEFVFVIIQVVLCFTTYVLTSNHSLNQLVMYIPAFIVLAMLILDNTQKKIISNLFILIFAVSPIMPYTANDDTPYYNINRYSIFPDFSLMPNYDMNSMQVLKIKQYLNQTIGLNKTIGVLSDSYILNDDMLRNCELSLNVDNKRDLTISDIDFSNSDNVDDLFKTDYMVVAYPTQTTNKNNEQKMLTNAVNCFYENINFAKAFEPISEIMYIGDVQVVVYKKMRVITTDEMLEFKTLMINNQ